MPELAPILEELGKRRGMDRRQWRRTHNRQLHWITALSDDNDVGFEGIIPELTAQNTTLESTGF
jgi:hypothetical protein